MKKITDLTKKEFDTLKAMGFLWELYPKAPDTWEQIKKKDDYETVYPFYYKSNELFSNIVERLRVFILKMEPNVAFLDVNFEWQVNNLFYEAEERGVEDNFLGTLYVNVSYFNRTEVRKFHFKFEKVYTK